MGALVMPKPTTVDLRILATEKGCAVERSSVRDRVRILTPDRTYAVDPTTGAAAFSVEAALDYLREENRSYRRRQPWHTT